MTTLRDFQLALQKNLQELEQKNHIINDLLKELSGKNEQIIYLHLKLARCIELMRRMRLEQKQKPFVEHHSDKLQNSTESVRNQLPEFPTSNASERQSMRKISHNQK